MADPDRDDITAARRRLAEAEQYLRLEEIRDRRLELEDLVGQPDLWDEAERAREVNQELAEVTDDIETFDTLTGQIEDAETLLELAAEEADADLDAEIAETLTIVSKKFDELELRSLFTGEHDDKRRGVPHPVGRGRHRRPGLGRHVVAHVQALGRQLGPRASR